MGGLSPIAQGQVDPAVGQLRGEGTTSGVTVGDGRLETHLGRAIAHAKSSSRSSTAVCSMIPATSGEKGAGCP